MKKVISVVGARPNFMKVAPIHRAFQKYSDSIEHLIVHTGQHYDQKMSDAFFNDLEMPHPNYFLGVGSGTHAEQTAKVMIEFEKICFEVKPDFVIVVGDVNSTLACALVSAKLGIKFAHIEAGLRSYDREMPEEINRIVTDSIADYCFVTEQSGYDNLIGDGYDPKKIYFCGNTMIDSLHFALPKANQSKIHNLLSLEKNEYILVTLHRPSNVDSKDQLSALLDILADVTKFKKVVFPIHPRTMKNIENFGLREKLESNEKFLLIDPLGYIDFLALMKDANLILTDSGGIQEETTVLNIPCITLRTSTERPVTCELGSNLLINPNPNEIKESLDLHFKNPKYTKQIPPYWDGKTAERITEIINNLLLNL